MFEVGLLPLFGLFSAGSKTKSAACCDVRYGEQRFHNQRNKVNTNAAVGIFFVALLFLRRLNIHDKHQSKHCFYMGRSRMASPYPTS